MISYPPLARLFLQNLVNAQTPTATDAPTPSPRLRTGFAGAAGATLCLALIVVVAFLFYGKVANNHPSASPAVDPQPQRSIAVLPFLDLTEGMKVEKFADGMTEELIDKLSRNPGRRAD